MTDYTKVGAESPNPADERRAQLAALLPEAFTEGKLDVAALKRAFGEEVIIEGGERYALTWAGKGNAYKVLQAPSTATLRPERDKSVNFDQAQHVFIEGENLEVLKVLQKAYFGEVKLIYRCAPRRAKRGRVVRGRRRSGRVAAGHLQGHRYAVQLLWASLLCARKAHGSPAGRPRHLVAERRDHELR